jgi:hypothetical protein
LQVKQLNGSTAKALGYGMKLLQCPTTKFIILLWPTYFMPDNPQCTFSPTALRHYLHYTITTVHLDSLMITTSTGVNLQFPSLKDHSANQLLDYHNFIVVCPKATKPVNLHQPIVNSATSESPLTRVLVHQRLGHNCDEVLDIMCRRQSVLGLPSTHFHQENAHVLSVSLPKLFIHHEQKLLLLP